MTRTIVAILALSPAMLFAQATVPAQPSSTPVLLSSLALPAASAASNPADPAKAASTPVRTTTGVVPPMLLSSAQPEEAQDSNPAVLHIKRTVVIDLTVDLTGKPTDLKVAQSSLDSSTDADALKAVSAFRFRPATLDGEPTSIPMRLHYVVQRPLHD